MFISLVITTRGDRATLSKAVASAKDANEIIVVTDKPRKEHITRLIEGTKRAKGDFIMTMTDRTILKGDWRRAIFQGLTHIGGSGVVTFDQNFCGLAGLTRDFLYGRLGGYFYHPDYIHYNGDQELGDVARGELQYIEVPNAHLYNERIPKADSSQSQEFVDYDKATYDKRTLARWPITRVNTMQERKTALEKGLNGT